MDDISTSSTQAVALHADAEVAPAEAASAQPVLNLADAGDITGRNDVPESSLALGGANTCITTP